jgi:hypothetical protein
VWVLSSCIKASPKLSLSSRDVCLRSSHKKNRRTKPRLTLHARLFWTKSLKMPFSYWNPLRTQKPGSYSGSPIWILATVLSAQSKNLNPVLILNPTPISCLQSARNEAVTQFSAPSTSKNALTNTQTIKRRSLWRPSCCPKSVNTNQPLKSTLNAPWALLSMREWVTATEVWKNSRRRFKSTRKE